MVRLDQAIRPRMQSRHSLVTDAEERLDVVLDKLLLVQFFIDNLIGKLILLIDLTSYLL